MQMRSWLSSLFESKSSPSRSTTIRRTARTAIIESLEPRQLLSGSPIPVGSNSPIFTSTAMASVVSTAVASDAAGDYVVVWLTTNSTAMTSTLTAQRYNAAGVAQGNSLPVASGHSLQGPAVAMDSVGNFAIAWDDSSHVMVQRYNSAGVKQGLAFQTNTGTTATIADVPSIAMDAAGDFVVTWDRGAQFFGGYNVYARRYNAAGVAQGGEFHVNSASGRYFSNAVAMDQTGNFVITWVSGQTNGSISALRYNAAGVAQGSIFNVYTPSSSTDQIANTSIAMDQAGDFVIAFASNSSPVMARSYNANGTPKGNTFGVADSGNAGQAHVAMDATGDFAVTWFDLSAQPTAVLVKSYNAAGIVQGTQLTVNTTTSAGIEPKIAMDATGDFVLSWYGFTAGGNNLGNKVFTQRFGPSHNHAPVGAPKTVTTLEDKPYVLKTTDFGFTDPNDNPANSLVAVKITTLPAVGSLTNNGTAVTAGSSIAVADITGGKLKFTPVANKNGATYASFTFQVQDNGGKAHGGVDTDTTARKMTIAVTSVNDAPAGAAKTVTAVEDIAYVLKAADFGFTDPNDVPANALLSVKITTLPAAGILVDNGIGVAAGAHVSAADIVAGKLKFIPVANKNGATYASLTFQVQDNGGTTNGGVDTDPTARKMTISVASVNDAPVGKDATVITREDVPYVFKVPDFGMTDPKDTPPNVLLSVKIVTLPSVGSLTDNGVAVTAGAVIPAVDIATGKLKFTPVANKSGAPYASFNFQVRDNGGTTNKGVDLDPTARKMTIAVLSVNDAPISASKTVSTTKNTAYVFKITDFVFVDPNDNPANSLLAVRITVLPTVGQLTDNGVAVAAGAHILVADIVNGKLKFTPANNGTGAAYASFQFRVQDNGGIALGGIDTDLTARTMTISVS